jgi:TolA-binding protein
MDCEGFDEIVLNLLYEDEPQGQVTDEARRHAEGCPRCAAALASLQQARAQIELPSLPVPPGLAARILTEVEQRQRQEQASWWGRLDRTISLLGSFAMRPQTAMGALLVLMTGLSLVLLRAKPAERGTVRITEHGIPAPPSPVSAAPEKKAIEMPSRKEEERARAPGAEAAPAGAPRDNTDPHAATQAPAAAPLPTPSAEVAAATTAAAEPAGKSDRPAPEPGQEATFTAAMEHYKARRYSDAMRAFDIVANGGGGNSGVAALYAARSARYSSGCNAALPRFDAIANRQVGSSAASEATWEAALCYREMGQGERARQLFLTLRRVAGYRDRVEKELNAMEQRGAMEPAGAAAKPASP